jgi:hypothetical protein
MIVRTTSPMTARLRLVSALGVIACLASGAVAQVAFRVGLDPKVAPAPVSGRLVISLIPDGAPVEPQAEPNDAPFWNSPQPMFGVDVSTLAPGSSFTLDASTPGADFALAPLKDLPPGKYRAQARLITTRLSSHWDDDPGNLASLPVRFEVPAGAGAAPVNVDFTLNVVTASRPFKEVPGAELFEIKSELLSAFHHREVKLRAGVVFPTKVEPGKKYAAVYETPGFGGDHREASRRAMGRSSSRDADRNALAEATYWIILDPESPNGHHLFADSDNNGPVGEALVKELIPALEKKYPLVARPEARLLRGHSSGGWSTVWLAITYPETFGAAWATSPDPVDFHAFQLVDIYDSDNFFTDPATGKELVSYRTGGVDRMTIRQENGGERVLGPNQTSGQQWASWQAVWGPRVGEGPGAHPAALYDSVTGKINKGVLDNYRKYDVTDLVRHDPKRYGEPLRRNLRIAVGDADDFSLNVAVGLLKKAVDALPAAEGAQGYIHILPGLDHASIMQHPSVRAIAREMLEHLRASGLAK